MKQYFKKVRLKELFKEEDSKFLLTCGIKFSSIFVASAVFIYYSMWIIVSLNSIYFEANSFHVNSEIRGTFFQSVFSFFYGFIPEIMGFLVFLFFAGVYIGKVLLRPFEVIGHHCLSLTEGKESVYNPNLFTEYKLLAHFSEIFFLNISKSLKKGVIKKVEIPLKYSRIHTPPFEKVFFFHFTLIVLILAGVVGFFVGYMAIDVQSEIFKLVSGHAQDSGVKSAYFLKEQLEIFRRIVTVSSLIIFVGYVLLSFHLYAKISGAIFGFFATMRAFMKGNVKARVHLIGYSHIRRHGRYMNKFLDHVERQCSMAHNKDR